MLAQGGSASRCTCIEVQIARENPLHRPTRPEIDFAMHIKVVVCSHQIGRKASSKQTRRVWINDAVRNPAATANASQSGHRTASVRGASRRNETPFVAAVTPPAPAAVRPRSHSSALRRLRRRSHSSTYRALDSWHVTSVESGGVVCGGRRTKNETLWTPAAKPRIWYWFGRRFRD